MVVPTNSKMDFKKKFIVVFEEYNAWERETWIHAYLCSNKFLGHAEMLRRFFISFNKRFPEQEVKEDKTFPFLQNQYIDSMASYYTIQIIRVPSAIRLKGIESKIEWHNRKNHYKCSTFKELAGEVPHYAEIKKLYHMYNFNNNNAAYKNMLENEFDNVYGMVYKKFGVIAE